MAKNKKDRKKMKSKQNVAKNIERSPAPRMGPTPQQDLALLDRASSSAPLPRNTHIQIQQAVGRIGKALQEGTRALQELDVLKKEK